MTEIKWKEGLKFEAISTSGSMVIFDSLSEDQMQKQNSFKPMEMLLVSLIGCTGMDVISILLKMKEDVKEFRVRVEGKRKEEHPKIYTKISLCYYFKGINLDKEKVLKAINLSQNKYCSISEMLRKSAEINYTYEIQNI